MNKKGFIVLLSGPSGVGKGTILTRLLSDPELNLTFSVSMTTRAPREGEKHGEHYFFVTHEEFNEHLQKNNFLEHASFVANHYGTPKDYVFSLLNKGRNVLIEIDVKGAKMLLENVNKDEVLSFFIMPPSTEELVLRLRGRGTEDEATINKRVAQFNEEIKFKDQYKYIVINDDLETCMDKITTIIKARINQA